MAVNHKMISFVPSDMEDRAPYHLLTSVVAPRPIAWISTLSMGGISNLAPFSFFNAVAGFPPTIMFSISYRRREPRVKDTLQNVREIEEFVCHIVDEATAGAMARTAMDWPSAVNEIDEAGLTAVPSCDVRPMRVKQASVAMECKVTQIIPVERSMNVMVLGQVLRFHIREELYRPELGLVDTVAMKPIMRLGGPVEYTKIGELFLLPVPDL